MNVELGVLFIADCTFRNCSAIRDGAVSFEGFEGQLLRCQGWDFHSSLRSFGRFFAHCLPDTSMSVQETSIFGGLSEYYTLNMGSFATCTYPSDFSCQGVNVSSCVATDWIPSGFYFALWSNDPLKWQFCTSFRLQGGGPVIFGADGMPECSFSAHCLSFLNNSATLTGHVALRAIIAAVPSVNGTLTSCVIVGNICSSYFAAWSSQQPLYVRVIDCILETPAGVIASNGVTFESVRPRMLPMGVELTDLTCPLGSESFTQLAMNYPKRRRILSSFGFAFMQVGMKWNE
jgi:hypothetical protein